MKARLFVALSLSAFLFPVVAFARDFHVSHPAPESANQRAPIASKVCSQPTYVRQNGKFVPVTGAICGDDGFKMSSAGNENRKLGERTRN